MFREVYFSYLLLIYTKQNASFHNHWYTVSHSLNKISKLNNIYYKNKFILFLTIYQNIRNINSNALINHIRDTMFKIPY